MTDQESSGLSWCLESVFRSREKLRMQDNTNSEVRDAVLLAGGVALVVFGAGLVLAHPTIRRTLLGGAAPLGFARRRNQWGPAGR